MSWHNPLCHDPPCREALSGNYPACLGRVWPALSETRHVRHSRCSEHLYACAWRGFERCLDWLAGLRPLSARKRRVLTPQTGLISVRCISSGSLAIPGARLINSSTPNKLPAAILDHGFPQLVRGGMAVPFHLTPDVRAGVTGRLHVIGAIFNDAGRGVRHRLAIEVDA
jgi:hypothetical protein